VLGDGEWCVTTSIVVLIAVSGDGRHSPTTLHWLPDKWLGLFFLLFFLHWFFKVQADLGYGLQRFRSMKRLERLERRSRLDGLEGRQWRKSSQVGVVNLIGKV
jgi:hypothetical protein